MSDIKSIINDEDLNSVAGGAGGYVETFRGVAERQAVYMFEKTSSTNSTIYTDFFDTPTEAENAILAMLNENREQYAGHAIYWVDYFRNGKLQSSGLAKSF